MAPGSASATKESDTDEEYLISMARCCQKNDTFSTKSWILTAKTLFPDNFGIQYEAYCLAKDNGNTKEASNYLEEMFRKFTTEHRLWDEVYKIANALRADALDAEAVFLKDMFSHLPTASQHDILLSIAEHCMDTAEHCCLMLLLLQKFPEKVAEHGLKLIDTLQMAEKHSHCQSPVNQFRKLLVCDVAPLVLKAGMELPAKQTFRLIHKCIEFYVAYIHTPSSPTKLKLDFPSKSCTENEPSSASLEADLWAQLFSFMATAGYRLHWELSDLLTDPMVACTDAQWQRAKSLLVARNLPADYSVSGEGEDAYAAQHKQVFYCTVIRFLHSLYNYGKCVNPSWFPGSSSANAVRCILIEAVRWLSTQTEQPKQKKRKVDADKEMEPPSLTVSKCVTPETAVLLTQSFLTAIKCWSILQYLKKELARLSQQIHMEEWPWFQCFLIDSLMYQEQYKEGINKLFKVVEGTADAAITNKANLQLASCFYSLGDYSTACSKLLEVVCSLPETSVAAAPTSYHPPEALPRKSERKLVFLCYDRSEILRYCMKALITCFKEKVLAQFSEDDLALGHLIVMAQYDWPEEEQLFLKLLEIIKKQGTFCYSLFFNYIINADMLEEFMYMTTSNGGNVVLDLLPSSTTQVGRQRAVTRGVNKGAKEDLKLAMEKQMTRSEDDMEQLLIQFIQEERDLLQQQL
ncbi:integrator complex subunit 10-like isoform X2 [Ornithodoros turicata]|uniref:Integrator complex subunit 10 n=1 Tax=Ornithodoros turicata TaxID=34597 RepID=A0A2R5L6Z7_9ACAR